jgi:hypothetical protein
MVGTPLLRPHRGRTQEQAHQQHPNEIHLFHSHCLLKKKEAVAIKQRPLL